MTVPKSTPLNIPCHVVLQKNRESTNIGKEGAELRYAYNEFVLTSLCHPAGAQLLKYNTYTFSYKWEYVAVKFLVL